MTPPTWWVGVDIGGTWARVMAACSDGRRVEAVPQPVPTGYRDLITTVTAMVPDAVHGIEGAACGIPGTYDGGCAQFVPALPWLEGRSLGADLAVVLGAPVQLGNDGHFTLLAEVSEGAAAGTTSAVLVAVGTGIGGALMTGGRIWRGHHGSAGSWGWLAAPHETTASGSGPFERAASGAALSVLAQSSVATWSVDELMDAARRRDGVALSVVARYAERLSSGIAAIASTVDPQVIILGGGVSAAMDLLAPVLARHIQALASPNGQKVMICAAALGPRAGVVGSTLAAMSDSQQWYW